MSTDEATQTSGGGRHRNGLDYASWSRRWATVSLIALLGLTIVGGCRSTERGGTDGRSRQAAAVGPGVDPTRAFVPLSQIEPAISPPRHTEAATALSGRALKEIEKANKLIEEQRYTEAAIELQKTLRFEPNHPEIQRTLAMLHWEAGNIERAKTHAARALDLNPDDAGSHYVMGRCLLAAGDDMAALTEFRTALLCSDFAASDTTAALCHYHLAAVLSKLGYLEASLGEYGAFESTTGEKTSGASGELRLLLQTGKKATAEPQSKLLELLGRYGEAADALSPLVSERGADVALAVRRARLLTQANRLDEALNAIRQFPADRDEVFDLLFEIHQRSGQPGKVIEELRTRIAARPNEPELVLRLASALTKLGQMEDAERELAATVRAHPQAYTVRLRLIDSLLARSGWVEAVRVAAEGIEQTPDRTLEFEARVLPLASDRAAMEAILAPGPIERTPAEGYVRGLLALQAGRMEEAERLLEQAHEGNRDFVAGRAALARLYFRQMRYGDALRIAARPPDGEPQDARLEMILGETHERLDDTARAEQHFKAVTQLDRDNTDAMLALAKLYRQSGQLTRAQRQLRVLLEERPNHEVALEMLAYTYLDEHKRDAAIEQYEILSRTTTDPRTKARCAALLEQVRKPEPDFAGYRKALLDTASQHGADAPLWIAIAESYTAEEEIAQKREAYRQALALDADNEEALFGVAQASSRLLEFEDAAAHLEHLLHRRPRRFTWMLSSGDRGTPGLIELYWLVGNYAAASDLVRRAESTEGVEDTWKRRFRLAEVETLRLSGRRDEALARLRQWAEEAPDDRAWNATLALEYQRQGRGSEAVPIWESLRRANPNDRDALRELVRSLMDAKRYDRAEQYILEWLDDDSENDLAIRWLATVLGGADRCDDALELARSRLLHTLAREELQDQVVTLLSGEKRYTECLDFIEGLFDEATDRIRALLEGREAKQDEAPSPARLILRPNEPFSMERLQARVFELRLMRAAVLIESGEFRTAEEELQSWLETAGTPEERFQYLVRLAESRRRGGNEPEANEVLARALTLRPTDSMMNNNVAYAWIDKGVRLDAGERMIRFALSREPRQPAFLDTFGWLLYKKGEFAEAVKWLLRARAGRPEDPVIHDHLGDAYWRLGQREEAVRHWEAAVAMVAKVTPERLENNADERRVKEAGPRKVEDAREGREPAVAPLAGAANQTGD